MQKSTLSGVLAIIVVVALCFGYPATICGSTLQGASFNSLEFDKTYIFPLSLESCFVEDGTSVGVADGGLAASAALSGFERVGFYITSDEDFEPSVIGKSGAVLELSLTLPDINGFLDSSGNFIGGEVILSVDGIEYHWSLEDVNISQGENVIRLSFRTATALSLHMDEEDLPVYDEEEDENAAVACSLGVWLSKLPSTEKASFVLREAAVEIPRVGEEDKGDVVIPSDDIGKTEVIVALIIGVAIISTILIWTLVIVKKEEKKRRRKRRKKRIESND